MSALTDFFTSLANKIRSKLGTSITYTPIDAISAIDDVYDKGVADTKVGNATADLVYRGRTFTNSSGVGLTGTMPSRIRGSAEDADTELTTSDNCPVYVASNSGFATNKDNVDRFYMAIPKNGYYTLNNAVLAVPCQTKNATPDISSQVINPDAGKALWGVVVNAITPQRAHQSVTAGSAGIVDNKPFIWIPYGYYPNQGNDHCGIYTTEAVAQAIHRHTGTYTFAANDTGGTKDLGEFHGYRYVNAGNVYTAGKNYVINNCCLASITISAGQYANIILASEPTEFIKIGAGTSAYYSIYAVSGNTLTAVQIGSSATVGIVSKNGSTLTVENKIQAARTYYIVYK